MEIGIVLHEYIMQVGNILQCCFKNALFFQNEADYGTLHHLFAMQKSRDVVISSLIDLQELGNSWNALGCSGSLLPAIKTEVLPRAPPKMAR